MSEQLAQEAQAAAREAIQGLVSQARANLLIAANSAALFDSELEEKLDSLVNHFDFARDSRSSSEQTTAEERSKEFLARHEERMQRVDESLQEVEVNSSLAREDVARRIRDWIHEQDFSKCDTSSDTCADWDMAYQLTDLILSPKISS